MLRLVHRAIGLGWLVLTGWALYSLAALLLFPLDPEVVGESEASSHVVDTFVMVPVAWIFGSLGLLAAWILTRPGPPGEDGESN
ncbi:hypothetical protein BH23CHL8_BH23CHL8_01740 [soil metagenome]